MREVVAAAQARRVPIRIGVNAGSVEKRLLVRYGGPTPRAMAESALGHVAILEDAGFRAIMTDILVVPAEAQVRPDAAMPIGPDAV